VGWLRGPPDGSMAGLRVHDIVVRDGIVWVATERGVAARRVTDPTDGRPAEWSWVERDAGRAFALAAVNGGVWAGTERGVVLIPTSDSAPLRGDVSFGAGAAGIISSPPVRALLVTGDTLWVGTENGLHRMRLTDAPPRLAGFANAMPIWFQRPTVALARSDSIIAAATDERVALIDIRRGTLALPPGEPDLARLGRLRAVAIDARTIWVGGDRGAASIDRTTGLVRGVTQPGVLADAVFDIVLQPEFAWLATPAGLVRVRRLPDGGPR
jgi:hypothetical protein